MVFRRLASGAWLDGGLRGGRPGRDCASSVSCGRGRFGGALFMFCKAAATERPKSSSGRCIVDSMREGGLLGPLSIRGAAGSGLSSLPNCDRGAGAGGLCCFARSISIRFSRACCAVGLFEFICAACSFSRCLSSSFCRCCSSCLSCCNAARFRSISSFRFCFRCASRSSCGAISTWASRYKGSDLPAPSS
jgi:hypothetical protein